MISNHNRVCPVERAGSLDNRLRSWVQNPRKILSPYLSEGMTALDLGCGPGFFTIEMARLVGPAGQVVAVDLQQGMLDKLRQKITGSPLEARIVLHRCDPERIGWTTGVDFALVFYMLHEVPDQTAFFTELAALLRPQGKILVVEPPVHVSKAAFEASLEHARSAGLVSDAGPKVFFSKSAILHKPD